MLYNKGGVTIIPYKTASNLLVLHIKPKKTTIVKKEDYLLSQKITNVNIEQQCSPQARRMLG